MLNSIGPTNGTTIKVISIKSRINPSRNMSSMTTSIAENTPPGRLSKTSSINTSPPKPRNTDENIAAPTKIR